MPGPLDDTPKRSGRQRLGGGLSVIFFVLGSVLNLLALILLIGNVAVLSRLWLTGAPVALGMEHLAPVGAFLAGIICYLIAYNLD
jgi:hypothetical protein